MTIARIVLLELAILLGTGFLLAWLMTSAGLAGTTRMALPAGHWARELGRRAGFPGVEFYHRTLPPESRIAAYAVYRPGDVAVVFNLRYLFGTSQEDLTFITGHELGHHALGHTRRGFWRIALLYGLVVPIDPEHQAEKERQADAFAAELTGITRTMITRP